jgi:hypothetical protein
MKRMLVLLALCATVAAPAVALGQQGPPMGNPPTPEQRAAMEKARADAKAAVYNALTPAHVAGVTAIMAKVTAGTLDRRAASAQIDALLTPDETKAVLAAGARARSAMRPGGPPPPGAGPPPPGAGPPPGGGRFGPPSAGRLVLMLSMPPRQRRGTMPQARSTAAP